MPIAPSDIDQIRQLVKHRLSKMTGAEQLHTVAIVKELGPGGSGPEVYQSIAKWLLPDSCIEELMEEAKLREAWNAARETRLPVSTKDTERRPKWLSFEEWQEHKQLMLMCCAKA